jgi:predicted RND superfamily exporter protein
MAPSFLPRLALFGRRRYRLIFALTAILVVACLAGAARLRFDTDFLDLLPRDSPEISTFRRALDEFGSLDYLLIAVRLPEDPVLDPYEAFVDDLGGRLEGLEMLERVEFRLGEMDELIGTFLPRALLFLDAGERQQLLERLDERALEERAKELRRLVETPQAMALEELLKLDPLGLAEIFLERLTASRSGLSLDWTSGYMLSNDHRMLLILAKPRHSPEDIDRNQLLVDAVRAETAAALAGWPDLVLDQEMPLPEVGLGGRYVIALGDDHLIRRDVLTNLVTSMVGVLVLFLFAFRRFGPLLYAFVPLSCGLIFTFGFTYLAFGELNAATSGVAALLIGLGIDFVIVSYARFVEERQAGATLEEGLARMSGSSGRAVIVGGVTSAATFYAFAITDFTGLREMGLLTGSGILLCMVAVVVLLPAMLAAGEDRHSRRRSFPRLYLHGFFSGAVIRRSIAHPRLVLAIGLTLTVAAAVMCGGLRFDDTIQAMRPAGNPGVAVRDEVGRHFGTSFDQMMLIIEAPELEEVLELAELATERGRQLVAAGELTGFDSVTGILPPLARQREALDWLDEHRQLLDGERVRADFGAALAAEGLRSAPFEPGLDLLAAATGRAEPVTVAELESSQQMRRLIDRYLRQDDDGWSTVMYLYPPQGRWRREPPPAAVQLAEELGPRASLTGFNTVSAFFRSVVLTDARLAALAGIVLVACLLWLDYRRLSYTLISLAPLAVGIVWMLGAMVVLGITMNFMNIFVSTMIIGIGVDYGVHMIHRHRESRGADVEQRLEGLVETGKAIAVAAMSTMIGFGSLSLSHYPGLRSMGLVAILGALTTGLVAITLLPAWFALRLRGKPSQGRQSP